MNNNLWRFGLTALLAACGGGDATDPVDDTTDTTDTTADTDTGDTDVSVPSGPLVLSGTLRDAAGALVNSGIRVQYCRGDACRTAHDVTAGVYHFYDVEAGAGSFEVVNLDEGSGRISVFAPFTLDGTEQELDVVLPEAGAPGELPASSAWVTVANGLKLELVEGQISPPTPFDPAVTEVHGARAVEEALPVEGAVGAVLAVYYLEPFNAEATTPIAAQIANSWSLASGEAGLWYADYATSTWTKLGDLTDDGAGNLTVATGLPKLTTLAVIRNPAM
jgi:hypothetical protein